MQSNNKIYFYPVWLRLWHGINALGIILLIITGLSMQTGMESNLISFNVNVKIHNISGIAVSLSYILFLIGNMVTPNGTYYYIKQKGLLKRAMKQAYYYIWGMFHGQKPPYPLSAKRKFNPLQKYSYVGVMYLFVPMVIITGFALLFPEIIIETVYNTSGILLTAVTHSAAGFIISVFLVIHIYVASIGKSPVDNFRSIINGWHHI